MQKYLYLLILPIFFASSVYAQNGETTMTKEDATSITNQNKVKDIPVNDTSRWTASALFSLNGTQSSFVNWSSGGRTSLSVLGFINGSASYRYKRWKWDNDLILALGGVRYFDKAPGRKYDKTDDRIDFQSTVGYTMVKHWLATFTTGFKTQMLDGFTGPEDTLRSSTFMAPGYLSAALGIEYAPSKFLNAFISPLAFKYTFVNDQTLANQGAYGVRAAQYDGLGNLLINGSRFRQEYGAYFRFIFAKELIKNVEMKSRLELFSNYQHDPQNVDVNAEVIFVFKVNSWLNASVQWNFIYDDDIKIRDAKGGIGPRAQFKSIIGLGVSYALKNQNAKLLDKKK